jgi:hypothetical protein
MISMQAFAVLVHEAICEASDECSYINVSSEDAENEYEYFRLINLDLKLLQAVEPLEIKSNKKIYVPTQAGYELLAAHNIYFPKERHEQLV